MESLSVRYVGSVMFASSLVVQGLSGLKQKREAGKGCQLVSSILEVYIIYEAVIRPARNTFCFTESSLVFSQLEEKR
jgi:hypothetical protein